jgi:hypothetical protein
MRVCVVAKCARDECGVVKRSHGVVDFGASFDQHVAKLRKS